MRIGTLQRPGGVSLIVGSALLAAYAVLWPLFLPTQDLDRDFSRAVLAPAWVWIAVIAFAGVVLMLFGFAAVYSRLYQQAGIVGLLGFVFLTLAYVLQAALVSWEICLYPVIAHHEPSVALLRDRILLKSPMVSAFEGALQGSLLLGILLFCTALIRSREFPKAGGILVLAGALVYAVGPAASIYVAIAGIAAFAVGCFMLGLRLMKPALAQPE